MKRTFMFAYQNCFGNTGGGHGIQYRLYRANQKYHLFQDIYFVFGDRVIHDEENCGSLAVAPPIAEKKRWIKRLKRMAPNWMWGEKECRLFQKKQSEIAKYLQYLHAKYHFSVHDTYLFHDLQTASTFSQIFDFPNTVLISHSQGSLYWERAASCGRTSNILRNYLNSEYIKTARKMRYLGFPAKGAEESMIASDADLKAVIQQSKRAYLYSGVNCPTIDEENLCQTAQELSRRRGYKFATVATLNEAKAVERIPQYLGTLKKKGYVFTWVLVGQGVRKPEVEREIQLHGIEDCVIWIQEYIAHDDILQILSQTDFYILFHRFSIFDLSTLEAMHYGNIPILTPVGGNKEVIIQDNGLFVSDFTDITSFEELVSHNLTEIKKRNQFIQQKQFNDRAFLERYAALISSFDKENDT